MDTNINSIQDRFSHDTIRYDDGELRNIISQLKMLHDLINTTIPSQVNTLAQKDSLWSGETKEQYLGLKDFIEQYQSDFSEAIGKLHEATDGLETLFYHIEDAQVLKDIESK